MNISNLESDLRQLDDPSTILVESSLYNHRVLFKKNKSNSISNVENHIKDTFQISQSISGFGNYITKKPEKNYNDNNHIINLDKISSKTDNQSILSMQKRLDSLDKNSQLRNNPKNKFYLNNSFKSFQFNNALKKSINLDSQTKRNPSVSNSNLPTDLTSIKVMSSRPKIPSSSIHGQKLPIGSKDKIFELKSRLAIQANNFSDYKALNNYKTSVDSYAKFVPSLKFPYCFMEFHDNPDQIDPNKQMLLEDARFEKAELKTFTKWKEDIRKKLESTRGKLRSSSICLESCASINNRQSE